MRVPLLQSAAESGESDAGPEPGDNSTAADIDRDHLTNSLDGFDGDELARLERKEFPGLNGPGERLCLVCIARVTVTPDGRELGHDRRNECEKDEAVYQGCPHAFEKGTEGNKR